MDATCWVQQSPCLGDFAGVQVFKALIEATFKGVSRDLWVSQTQKKTPQDRGHHVPAVVSESQGWLSWRAHTETRRHKSNL